jgi:hypothetical protein
MTAKPPLQIGLDADGSVVEIRVSGKKVKVDMDSKHKCAPGTKTVVLRLKFCQPSGRKKGAASAKSKPPSGPTPPCCMIAGGRLLCWPPCV